MSNDAHNGQLDHRAHMFQNTILLMLLEAGIQAEMAKSLSEALHKPGVMLWRESTRIMLFANFPSLSGFRASQRTMEQFVICMMSLRRTFDGLWGINATVELFKLGYSGEVTMLTIMLPSPQQERALRIHRRQH